MTKHEARELVAKYGSMTAAAERVGCGRGKIKRALAQPDEVENECSVLDAPAGVATFSLRGVSVLSKRPQDTLKGKLYGLKRGVGYKVEDLAGAWHLSVETLRKRAKEHGALGYVEATPGEFVAVVVHPESMKS